jgi:putative redox protein
MADVAVNLSWSGSGLIFDGGAATGPQVRLDGMGVEGPSPMTTLLLAFGGCMAADIVDIATKGRTPFTGLDLAISGDRAAEAPRRYVRIVMQLTVRGAAAADAPKFERALALSREKYCSVLHTLRQDTDFEFRLELA